MLETRTERDSSVVLQLILSPVVMRIFMQYATSVTLDFSKADEQLRGEVSCYIQLEAWNHAFRTPRRLSNFSLACSCVDCESRYVRGGTGRVRIYKADYGAMAMRRRLQASSQASRGAKAERRRNPSPPGPKPAPGMVTTCASSRILENMSHDDLPLRSTKT